MKFKTATNRWLKNHKHLVKESTYLLYEYTISEYIMPYFIESNLDDINNKLLQEFVNYLYLSGGINNKPLSIKTVKNVVTLLKQIIYFCFERNYCKQFFIKIRFPKENKIKTVSIFNDNELNTLKQYLIRTNTNKSIGILICIYTGIRIGEICGLKWGDINFNNNTININKTVQRVYYLDARKNKKSFVQISSPKTKNSIRTIPLSDNIIDLVYQLKSNEDCFVLTGTPVPDEPRNLRCYYKNCLDKCNIDFKKFHTLRHTFASTLIDKGSDPKVVSQLLGHAKVSTTLDLYVHPNINSLRNSINLLD